MVGGERVGRFLTKESRGKMWEVMKAQASRWSTMRQLLLCRDTSDDINDTYVYFLFSSRLILRTTELLMNEDTIEISSSPFPFPKKDPSIDFRVINVYLYTLHFDSNITDTTIFIMIYQRLYIFWVKNFYFEFPSGIPKFAHLERGGREFTRSFTISIGRWPRRGARPLV